MNKKLIQAVIQQDSVWEGLPDYFLAGAYPNQNAISKDGELWIQRTQPKFDSPYGQSFCFNGSVFVGVGNGYPTKGIKFSYDGLNWRNSDINADFVGYCVIWDGSRFIAGGSNGWSWPTRPNSESLAYSADGEHWTMISQSILIKILSLCYNGTTYVASGINNSTPYHMAIGGFYYYTRMLSTDLTNWTGINSYDGTSAFTMLDCVWTGTRFVGVGQGRFSGYQGNGTAIEGWNILSSENAVNWTGRHLGDTSSGGGNYLDMASVAFNGSVLIAVGTGQGNGGLQGKCLRSTDGGLTWNLVTFGIGVARSVIWDGNNFLVVGNIWGGNGNDYHTLKKSPDGLTWTEVSTTSNLSSREFYKIFYANSYLLNN